MKYIYEQPFPYLYHFRDPQGVNFTLIKGKKKAILFDTGYGLGNIRAEIEKLITTPYIVINSHGHMDHSSGNYLFDKVYINEKDFDLCIKHNSIKRRNQNVLDAIKRNILEQNFNPNQYVNAKMNIVPIDFEEVDLGDLHVKVIPMSGHTQGSIGLLIKETKLLLTGDAAISMVWLFLPEATSKADYIKMLEKVKLEAFDYFITGHLNKVFPKRYFDYYLDVAFKATKTNSCSVSFPGFERPNTYQYLDTYENEKIGIVFYEE
jgi:glyoxylase-like metal-dependent hydrolase (beta-lactamase superfamily II)